MSAVVKLGNFFQMEFFAVYWLILGRVLGVVGDNSPNAKRSSRFLAPLCACSRPAKKKMRPREGARTSLPLITREQRLGAKKATRCMVGINAYPAQRRSIFLSPLLVTLVAKATHQGHQVDAYKPVHRGVKSFSALRRGPRAYPNPPRETK